MHQLFKKRSKKVGLPPGVLYHLGEKMAEQVKITVIDYDPAQFEEKIVDTVEECFGFRDKTSVTWINVDGLHKTEILKKLGTHFGVHPLILEDILNTDQRPKMDDFGHYIYIVLKMLTFNDSSNEVASEQVSLIVGSNYVISFQESEGDVFDPTRLRIRHDKGRIRKMGADFLAYSLMDAIVDHYFAILEKLGEKVEALQENLIEKPSPHTIQAIHNIKKETIYLRKSVWPLREVINGLQRSESALIQKSTLLYLKDVYDHTVQTIDNIELLRDMISGMVDIYLSSINNRMNESMKILAAISTIFIPLTFITGIYGMNFKHMPGLEWRWGYFSVIAIMFSLGVLMATHFRRKKWL